MTTIDATIIEIVLATTVLDKYADVVKNILRDEESGWTADYYKSDGRTSLDPEIGRMVADKKGCDEAITDNERLMTECDRNINHSRLPKTDPKYKKATPADVSRWDKQFVQAQEDIMHDANHSDYLGEQIELWSWNRYIEQGRMNRLKGLRDKYKDDGDLEFLRKGVSWACASAERQSYDLFVKEVELVGDAVTNESLSAW